VTQYHALMDETFEGAVRAFTEAYRVERPGKFIDTDAPLISAKDVGLRRARAIETAASLRGLRRLTRLLR